MSTASAADEAVVDPYAHPGVYDILHTPGTAHEVDLLERLFRTHAPGLRGRWLEPACGTGRYLRVLAGRGYRGTGIDLDRHMLAYAEQRLRRRGLLGRVRLIEADMAAFADHLPPHSHAVAFNLVNSLRHLLDGRQVRQHFDEVRRVLHPDGVYVVGISFSRYGEEEPSEDLWTARRGNCSVRQVVQYLPPDRQHRREIVLSHLQIDRPSGRQTLDSRYELRSYDERQWDALLRRAGWRRLGAIDDQGRDVAGRILNYQLEVLRPD